MNEKILIVDDAKDTVWALKDYLEMEQYQVFFAYTGEEALKKATKDIDIIFLDIMMQPMSGIEVLERLKEKNSEIPVVMITAKTDVDTAVKCMKYENVYDYVTKPFSRLAILTEKIKSVLKEHHYKIEVKRLGLELEESKKYVSNIIRSMIDTLLVVNPDATIRTINRATADLLGYTEEELRGKPVDSIFAPAAETIFRDAGLEKLMEEGFVKDVEMTYLTKDKREIPMSFSGSVMRDDKGNLQGIVCVAKDLSELKRAEEVQREQYARLKEIDEMKSRFLSTATHELRTPLASIKGYTSMIRTGYAGKVPKKIGEMLEVVERNADRLSALTNDLLDQQRLESGRFQITPEPLKLQDIVDEAVQEIRPLVSKKNQELSIQIPPDLPPVKADKTRIIQVLINLLSNAFKYTPRGGNISLQIREAGEMVEVRVSDTGIGIAKEDMGKLFKPFPDIKKPGDEISTGLGLSICKGVIELHGGGIWAEPKGKDKGATFVFTMPKHGGAHGR